MVHLVDSEEEVETKLAMNPVRAKAKAPRSPIKQNTHTTAKVPQKAVAQKTTKQHSVKKEVTPLPMPVGTFSSREKMTEVPRFMEAMWSSSFLPTIYDSLGRSTKPFADFSKGAVVVSKLQEAINLTWPGTDYSIQWSDLACTKVNDSCCFNMSS